MSAFKVGQRVRVVYADACRYCIGLEATITATPGANPPFPDTYGCIVDGAPPALGHLGMYWGDAGCFSPINDPSADAFMERLRKLGREPVIVPEKVTA